MLRLCSGTLTLGSSKSGSFSRLANKTEPAKEKGRLRLYRYLEKNVHCRVPGSVARVAWAASTVLYLIFNHSQLTLS
jgi:3-deoxy-D-arabino-heptulosonate 7-phosphate (DAHP) synthase class II